MYVKDVSGAIWNGGHWEGHVLSILIYLFLIDLNF
jgi:hypothetical protein